MTILDSDIVVSPMNVKLGEVVSVFQLVHEVGDEGEGVSVTSGVFVEVPVILARTKFSILFLDKEEGRCLEGVGRTDLPSSQVFFEEVLGGSLFIRRKQVDFANLRHEGVVKVDLMIIWVRRGTWSVASFENTWAKSAYSDGSEVLGFTFSVTIASSIAVVSLAMNREFERKHLQLPWRILFIW